MSDDGLEYEYEWCRQTIHGEVWHRLSDTQVNAWLPRFLNGTAPNVDQYEVRVRAVLRSAWEEVKMSDDETVWKEVN